MPALLQRLHFYSVLCAFYFLCDQLDPWIIYKYVVSFQCVQRFLILSFHYFPFCSLMVRGHTLYEITSLQLLEICVMAQDKGLCWWIFHGNLRRMLDPTKKDTPHPRSKEKPQQDGRRGEIMFRIKPHISQRCLEGSNKNLCAAGDPTETEPVLPFSVWMSPAEIQVSIGLAGALAAPASPLARGRHQPHHRATRTYTGLGKQTLGGHKQNLLCTRTQEKGTVTPQRLTQTFPWVSRSLWWRHGSVVACCMVEGTECSSCTGPFEGAHHYLHYLHISLASGQITGREHSPTHQQKIGLKMALPITQDPVSPSVSLCHQEASMSLLSLSIRGQKEWKPQ